jgi:hypothetical protein
MILIDGDGLVYTYGFAAENRDKGVLIDLMPFKFVAGLLNQSLQNMQHLTGDQEFKIYLDGGSNFREEEAKLQPYKGNRNRGTRPQYYNEIRAYLIESHHGELIVGQEPDDELGIMATELGDGAVMATLDKDLNMIPGKHLNWRKGVITDITEEEGYRFFWEQCVAGDATDHIPSVYTQMVLQGREEEANILKHSSYIKKINNLLTNENDYSKMKDIVMNMYEENGLPMSNLEEVGRLLWIRRKRGELWDLKLI